MKMTINLRKVLFFLLTLCLIGSAYAQDTAACVVGLFER